MGIADRERKEFLAGAWKVLTTVVAVTTFLENRSKGNGLTKGGRVKSVSKWISNKTNQVHLNRKSS